MSDTPKTRKVTIYGASDDLIEVEGDIEEEFTAPEEATSPKRNGAFIAVSDGSLFRITYGANGEGTWRITPVVKGSARCTKIEASGEDSREYSDRVTLEGDIRWVAIAIDFAVQ